MAPVCHYGCRRDISGAAGHAGVPWIRVYTDHSASHRSFSVDKPTSTSIIVMIQNRTGWFWLRPPCRADATRLNLPSRLAFAETTPPFAFLIIYLNFSVESPTSTSIIVIIQKRTTTWFSFQPFSSK